MKTKYCLVLGGGGAKGCYEIGVWKALKKIKKIKIEAVIGTSVGALNGVLIAEGNFKKAENLWKNISIQKVIGIEDKYLDENKKLNLNILNTPVLLLKTMKGFNTDPLLNLMKENVDEKKVRKSQIDFGLTTLNTKTNKGEELFLEDIPEGKINEYLLASAALPMFEKVKIDNTKYLDGGLKNSVPYDTAKNRGYKNIIVVDISGIGVYKNPKIFNTETIYIKNSVSLGDPIKNTLNFSQDFVNDFMYLGYLDTLRIFDQIGGIKYFYKNSKGILKRKEKKVDKNRIKELLPSMFKKNKNLLQLFVEYVAITVKVEKLKLYTYKNFIKEIKKKIYTINLKKIKNTEVIQYFLEVF